METGIRTVFTNHPNAQEMLGELPYLFNEADPRPAAEQLGESYRHGGGWRPLKGWTMNPDTHVIRFTWNEGVTIAALTTLALILIAALQ